MILRVCLKWGYCIAALLACAVCTSGDAVPAPPAGYGLGFCISATNAPVPALHLALRYNLAPQDWSIFAAYRQLSLGELRLPELAERPAIAVSKSDRVSCTYTLTGKNAAGAEESVSVTAGRLTPAVLLELNSETIALFAGDKSGWASTDARWVKLWAERYKITLAEPRAPRRFAFSDSRSVRFGKLTGEGLEFEGAGQGWLLLWYGPDAWFFGGCSTLECHTTDVDLKPGDAPVLFVFSETPFISITGLPDAPGETAAGLGPEGSVLMSFPGRGAKIAIVPLAGYRFPDAAETAAWAAAEKLPASVKACCDWWARHLAEYPVAVAETVGYDAAADAVEWRAVFEYISLRPGGERCAPLPPMLELARQSGFPVAVCGAPVESGTPLYCGPYAVLEQTNGWSAGVSGMARYVSDSPATPPKNAAAAPVLAALTAETDRILAAGHLAPVNLPFKMSPGWGGYVTGRQLYFAPGKTLSTLAAALPFLDEERRQKLKLYLAEERQAYPPETVPHLPAERGARREPWLIPAHYLTNTIARSASSAFHELNKLMPAEALYDLAAYYAALGAEKMAKEGFSPEDAAELCLRPWFEREDWATLGWFAWPMPQRDPAWFGSYGWSQVADANRMANAFIGLARLSHMAGDSRLEHEAMARLARSLTHRFAVGKYAGWLYRQGGILKTPEEFDPARDPREVAINNETAILGYMIRWEGPLPRFTDVEGPYTEITPELARFFADFLKPEAAMFAELTAKYFPDAFITLGTPRRCQEWWHNYPQDNLQIFLTHARILGAAPEWLWRRLDVPLVPVGDLYYIDKLVALLEAWSRAEQASAP